MVLRIGVVYVMAQATNAGRSFHGMFDTADDVAEYADDNGTVTVTLTYDSVYSDSDVEFTGTLESYGDWGFVVKQYDDGRIVRGGQVKTDTGTSTRRVGTHWQITVEDIETDDTAEDTDDDGEPPVVRTDGGYQQTKVGDPMAGVDDAIAQQANEMFPFEGYRKYQREAYQRASQALYGDDKDVVILNLPTGIGKSGICTGLARQAESAFLTTPMKSLRQQLEDDDVLRSHYSVLRARADYQCDVFGTDNRGNTYTCASCPCGRGATEESCKDQPNCSYWGAKSDAMHADVATLTFAYLIIDGMIPTHAGGMGTGTDNAMEGDAIGEKISFGDRELLVTDEVHKLEDYVASLFAGTTISPYTVPEEVYGDMADHVDTDHDRIEDIYKPLHAMAGRAEDYVAKYEDSTDDKRMAGVDDCESLLQKKRHLDDELKNGRDWVVNVDTMTVQKSTKKKIELKPIDVDFFLKKKVWSRSDKIVLSTATMPHEDNPRKWLKRLGLGDKSFEYINYPMPFPEENRPIETDTQIAKFSSGGDKQHWNEIEATVDELIRRHGGEKGLIHTASYDRAEKLHKAFPDRTYLHDGESELDAQAQITLWQQSDKPVLLSPACMDGVDLEGDMCRWQVLLKVPYPFAGDSRVSYMLDERKAWNWYYEQTALNLIQSVGRGVRSKDDECVYYVLDRCWNDVMDRASIPDWFKSAIN